MQYAEMVIRLLLACVLGGIIGYEREHNRRPAGFRTHILVCVGSALVMLTSEFIFSKYSHLTTLDPSRLGAQVISGIGFLGAGTIIRDGFNVRGLTTAASLWAVSCAGVAIGSGYYAGAVLATILVFITLFVLKKTANRFFRKQQDLSLLVESKNLPGQLGVLTDAFDAAGIPLQSVEFIKNNSQVLVVKMTAKFNDVLALRQVIAALSEVNGVTKVVEE